MSLELITNDIVVSISRSRCIGCDKLSSDVILIRSNCQFYIRMKSVCVCVTISIIYLSISLSLSMIKIYPFLYDIRAIDRPCY